MHPIGHLKTSSVLALAIAASGTSSCGHGGEVLDGMSLLSAGKEHRSSPSPETLPAARAKVGTYAMATFGALTGGATLGSFVTPSAGVELAASQTWNNDDDEAYVRGAALRAKLFPFGGWFYWSLGGGIVDREYRHRREEGVVERSFIEGRAIDAGYDFGLGNLAAFASGIIVDIEWIGATVPSRQIRAARETHTDAFGESSTRDAAKGQAQIRLVTFGIGAAF